MTKRLLSMFLALILTVLMIPAVTAEDDTPSEGEGYYYVYTENGKSLNVRETPNGRVVGSLKYGSRVYVYGMTDENWALINFKYDMPGIGVGTYAAFINRRFLRRNKPEPRTSGSAAAASVPLNDLNTEFKSAKKVTPYAVTVRPSRVSGWVNMRWAPSNEAEIMATYKANDKLLVIWELDNWVQVEDQDTGDVGFVHKQFIVK